MVPRWRETASSQRIGLSRKAVGVIRTTGTPRWMACSSPPIKPMSWNRGSQVTNTSSLRTPSPCSIAHSLAHRLPWLIITPLGAEVEPEVYCRKAMSVPAGACGTQPSTPLPSSMPSMAMGEAPAKASKPSPTIATVSAVASRQHAWASTAMPIRRARC